MMKEKNSPQQPAFEADEIEREKKIREIELRLGIDVEQNIRDAGLKRARDFATPEERAAYHEELDRLRGSTIDDSRTFIYEGLEEDLKKLENDPKSDHNEIEKLKSMIEGYLTPRVSKMTQDEVADMILFARTEEEIIKARRVRDIWVKMYPDEEYEIWDISEGLERKAYGLGMPSAFGPGDPTKYPPAGSDSK